MTPKQWLKTTNIYYLAVSVTYKSGCGLAGGFWPNSPRRLWSNCQLGQGLSWDWAGQGQEDRLHFQTPPSDWQVSVLTTCASPQGCLQLWQLAFPTVLDAPGQNVRENTKWKPQPLYSLVSEVTPFHFCHILFIKSESFGPDHTQGWGCTRAWVSGGGGYLGPL